MSRIPCGADCRGEKNPAARCGGRVNGARGARILASEGLGNYEQRVSTSRSGSRRVLREQPRKLSRKRAPPEHPGKSVRPRARERINECVWRENHGPHWVERAGKCARVNRSGSEVGYQEVRLAHRVERLRLPRPVPHGPRYPLNSGEEHEVARKHAHVHA